MRKLAASLIFVCIHFIGFAQFSTGNLALLQAEASVSNTTCSVVEINTTTAGQTAINSYAISGAGANALRFSGSASSTGYLSRSNDKTLLCFTAANNTNTASNANTLNPRGVGTLTAAIAFNLATTYTGVSGNQTRSAGSLDNTNFYIGDQNGFYSNNATSPSPSGNIRSVKSFGGTVYAFTASATLAPVGIISAPTGGTYTGLAALANGASSRQDFYLVSSGANGAAFDVLYVLDATTATAGTIFKYSLVSGAWAANGTYTTAFGGFGLAAEKSGAGENLYVSTGLGANTANSVIKLNDAAGYNAAINITTANNINLYTAPTGKIVKGVEFVPEPALLTPPTIIMDVAATTNYLDGGAVVSPSSPYAISGVQNDNNDPASNLGISFTIGDATVPVGSLVVTATSSNTAVVAPGGLALTGSGASRNLRITPAALGYSTISINVSNGSSSANYVLNYAASQIAAPVTDQYWHTGNSDASAAIALDNNYMLLCDDERNNLYVFSRANSGLPAKVFNFNAGNLLALTDLSGGIPREVDMEATVKSIATAGRTYWLGSMSNSSSTPFNDRPNRNRLLAIDVSGTGASTTFANAGYVATLRQQLINWGDANGYNFSASAVAGKDSKLIDGFNLEGMVFAPDNTTLYFGFRAPLVPLANRTKAVIAPLLNFETWFNNGSPAGNPVFGAPVELDLGGRGIRDIIRLGNNNYVILAGSYDGVLDPAVYSWSGNAANAAALITTFDVTGLNVEGVMEIYENSQLSLNKLQVISDNGDEVYYGDNVLAKDLPADNFKKFRSNIIVSATIVLPVQFKVFNITGQTDKWVLQWQMAEADNLQSFEVLVSDNGRDFKTVAVVNAMPGQLAYSYNAPAGITSTRYYRIKAIGKATEIIYSEIRLIRMNTANNVLNCYPNPVYENKFSIDCKISGLKTIKIYDAAGKLITSFKTSDLIIDVNTTGWPKGAYWVRLTAMDGKAFTRNIVVK